MHTQRENDYYDYNKKYNFNFSNSFEFMAKIQ